MQDTSGIKKLGLPALQQSKSGDGNNAGAGTAGGGTAGGGTAAGGTAGGGSGGAPNGTSGSGEHTSRESEVPSQPPLHVELHQLILDFAR